MRPTEGGSPDPHGAGSPDPAPRRIADRAKHASPGRETRRNAGLETRPPWRVATFVTAAAVLLALWLRLGPLPPLDAASFTSATIVDRNGVVLYEPLSPRGVRGEWLEAADLPPNVVDATIAAEDRRFFQHVGLDPLAITRAALHDVRHLRVVEGGSTITQQVAKLLLASNNRGLITKAREAIVALRLEHRYSKRELLALYLNLAPYGNQTAGIVRASRRYFGVAPESLTPAQAAYLASLPQRPGVTRAATARQRVVLARMRALRMLDARAYAEARAERLRFESGAQPLLAPHFVERVRAMLPNARQRIVTTLDANLQRDVVGIIAAAKGDLRRR